MRKQQWQGRRAHLGDQGSCPLHWGTDRGTHIGRRGVGSTGHIEALALATREVDATEPSQGLVTIWQDLQVQSKGTGLNDLVVVVLIKLSAEEDGLAQRHVLAPRVLGNVSHLAACMVQGSEG